MFLKKILGKGIVLFYRCLGLLAGFLAILIISRLMNKTDSGVFFTLVTLVVACSLFSRVGFDKSLIPDIVDCNNNKNIEEDVLGRAFTVGLYGYSAIFFMALFLSIEHYWFLFCGFFLMLNNIVATYYKAKYKPTLSIIFESGFIYCVVLFFVFMVYLFNIEFTLLTSLLIYFLSVLVQTVIFMIVFRGEKINPLKKVKFLSFGEYFRAVKLQKNFILISYLSHMLRFLPIVFLGIYFSMIDVSSYKVIEQICTSVGVIVVAINSVYSPYYAKNKNNKLELRRVMISSTLISIFFGLIGCLFLFMLGSYLLGFARVDYYTYDKVFLILIISSFLSIISAPIYNCLIMIGKENQAVVILIFSTLFSLFLIIWGSLVKSLILVSASSLIFYTLQSIMSCFYFKRKYDEIS